MTTTSSVILPSAWVDQDLSYGEILARRPEAWFVKKYFLYECNPKKVEKGNYIDVHYEDTYPKKMTKPKATRRVFKLDSWYHFNGLIFVSFIR